MLFDKFNFHTTYCGATFRTTLSLLTKTQQSKSGTKADKREIALQNTKISFIIPTYNEAPIIKNTIETTLGFLESSFSDYELIVYDDGSTDETEDIVRRIDNPHLRIIGHKPNKGKGSAVREGVLASDGDIVVYTDADLAYGIETVGELLKKLQDEAAEIAIGSRRLHPQGFKDYPMTRLLASRLFSFLTNQLAGFHYDTQCGLKAFSAKAAKQIFSLCESDGFAFDFEVMLLATVLSLNVTQLPVKIINHRDSKVLVLRDSIKMFFDVIRIRFAVKERIEREIGSDKKRHTV